MSSIPQNKSELLIAIETGFKKLSIDYDSVPAHLTRTLAIEGNVKDTQISICDTLAYLTGWGELVLKWYFRQSKGEPVDFPETGYQWNELGVLAQHFQRQYSDRSFEELRSAYKETTDNIISLIQTLDNKTLYQQYFYKKYTLGRMIQFNTSSPMKNMRTKVRRFVKQQT